MGAHFKDNEWKTTRAGWFTNVQRAQVLADLPSGSIRQKRETVGKEETGGVVRLSEVKIEVNRKAKSSAFLCGSQTELPGEL